MSNTARLENEKPHTVCGSAGQNIRNGSCVADGADYTHAARQVKAADWGGLTADDALLFIAQDARRDAPLCPTEAWMKASDAIEAEEWAAPQPLPQKPPVALFSYTLLPDVLQGRVSDIAEHMQCPPDYIAAALVVGLSSVCAPVAVVQPKPGWNVTLNLWGAVVGRPGMMKSPAIDAALKPLHALQRTARQEHEQALQKWKQESALQEAIAKANKAEADKLARKDPARARALLAACVQQEPPALRRFIVNDATQEALGEIMLHSLCALYTDDELIALLRACDKQGQEGMRAFLLKAADGNRSHTWDRIGRGTVHVEKVALAVFGGIQPSKLAAYVYDAMHGGRGDDGLLQRFSLLVYPDIPPGFVDIENEIDEEAEKSVAAIFQRIAVLQTDSPRVLHLSLDAKEIFKAWRCALEIELREGKLLPALESHLAKYRKLVPALAGIFALVDNLHCAQIEAEHVRRAIEWATYLRSHAERVYFEQTETMVLAAARNLLEHLQTGDIDLSRGILNVRFVSRKQWSGLRNAESVRRACSYLCDAGYMRLADVDGNNKARTYIVHPCLRYTFAMREYKRVQQGRGYPLQ